MSGSAKPGQIAALKAKLADVMTRRARPLPAVDLASVRRAVAEETAKLAGLAPDSIREEQGFTEHLGLHALDRVELALALEDRLAIAGKLNETGWRTVGDAVRDVMEETRG